MPDKQFAKDVLGKDGVYRLPHYTLADLSDEMVRHMTEHDMTVLQFVRMEPLNAAAVMDELRFQQRWDRLHADHI